MSELSRFDFCPKCGALARDGVCQSCGYVNQSSVPKVQPQPQPQPQQYMPSNPAYQKPQKGNTALIVILVILVLLLAMVFTCCVGGLTYLLLSTDHVQITTEYSSDYSGDDKADVDESVNDEPVNDGASNDGSSDMAIEKPTQDVEGLENGLYYEGLYNALRDDLLYQVDFKVGELKPEEYEERVNIQVEYPQLTGAAPNLDIINSYLEMEYLYYKQFFEEKYEQNMTEDSVFHVVSKGYVTYMDEKVMSVVFQEEMYVDGQSMIQFYCLNFDMTDGVVMNNVDILNIDLEFAVDFRRREILENGDEWLTDYTDQEILELLRNLDHLVIFYTPMGMEVGLNLYEVVLYMTYSDYERFLKLY